MKLRSKILLVLGASISPFVALAQSPVVTAVTQQATSFPQTQMNLGSAVQMILGFMNVLIPVLTSAAIASFFFGLVRYIYDAGNSKGKERGRQAIIWGLVGLFLIFTLWGILRFLQMAFFGSVQ